MYSTRKAENRSLDTMEKLYFYKKVLKFLTFFISSFLSVNFLCSALKKKSNDFFMGENFLYVVIKVFKIFGYLIDYTGR